jgi:hypothetical protein
LGLSCVSFFQYADQFVQPIFCANRGKTLKGLGTQDADFDFVHNLRHYLGYLISRPTPHGNVKTWLAHFLWVFAASGFEKDPCGVCAIVKAQYEIEAI